jgi:hypothetical protein
MKVITNFLWDAFIWLVIAPIVLLALFMGLGLERLGVKP